ncbi:MAG: Hpt domain-containing protein, partial [Lachnospiraceae bacterium]|nr:Hpt domain-containing protein [Lachnospiraceae bacterium]
MDVSQYLEIFIDETKEHLQSLNTQILELEQNPENMDTINEVFRAAHSLKGMAGTMGYKRMQNLTHDMENVFSEVRNGHIKVNASMIDCLFQCLDALDEYLGNIQESGDEGTNDNELLIKDLNAMLNGGAEKTEDKKEEVKAEAPVSDTSKEKWKDIPLGDAENHVLSEAAKQGKNIIGLTVYVQESCILKAARAFLVFKALEDLGEIIVSNPSAQDIEDEKFEYEFSIIMIADCDAKKAIDAASYVSEIHEVVGSIMTPPTYEEAEEVKEEVKEENVATQAVQEVPATKKEAKAPAATATAEKNGKPVVNRTVRVDIEKLDVLMNLVSELISAKNSLVS